MKKWLLHIIYLGVLALITSCNSNLDEDTLIPSDNAEKVSVTFTLAMDGTSPYGSRAVESEEVGNSDENYIDVSGLQVIAYSIDGNNTYLGEVKNITAERDWDSESGHIYEFRGDMDYANDRTLNCKFMVYANCGTKVTETTGLSNLSYSYSPSDFLFPNANKGIPMWGVLQVTDIKLTPNSRTDLGTIYLLRAMAKVEVALDDAMVGKFKLVNAAFNMYNQSGYCLPNEYATASGTKEIDIKGYFNANAGNKGTNLAFTKYSDNHFIAYIPEYDNSTSELEIPVTITDANGNTVERLKDVTVKFQNYTDKTPFDAIRNHYYKYNITIKEDPSGNIKTDILTEVMKWGYVDVESDYE